MLEFIKNRNGLFMILLFKRVILGFLRESLRVDLRESLRVDIEEFLIEEVNSPKSDNNSPNSCNKRKEIRANERDRILRNDTTKDEPVTTIYTYGTEYQHHIQY